MFSILKCRVAIVTALCAFAMTADGQSTVCRANEYASESDENIREILEGQGRRLQTLSSAVEKINRSLNALLENMNGSLQRQESPDNFEDDRPVVYDCSDVKASGNTTSGVHRLYVHHEKRRYYADAYCNMTAGGNRVWTVFQRRKDGSEDFYRGWNDYANGFGTPTGEFWLGNEFLHLLTTKRKYRLRIDLEDFEGNWRFAEYSTFSISSSADKYRLLVSGYSGDAGGESFSHYDGRRFTTKDSDNDRWASGNSAEWHRGSWWYDNDARSNLNGIYLRGKYPANCSSTCSEGIWWKDWRGPFYSLKTTEMKISSTDA